MHKKVQHTTTIIRYCNSFIFLVKLRYNKGTRSEFMITMDNILEKLITLSNTNNNETIDFTEVVEDMKVFVLENNKSSTG